MITKAEIRADLLRQLAQIAPDADLAALPPDADLRDELDIDSMDFLRLVRAIDRDLHVSVPEADYPKLRTLEGCTDYVAARLGGA